MGKNKITNFHGTYHFLSNFYASPITIDDITYSTVEHFFQAQKTFDPAEQDRIIAARTPKKTKQISQRCTLQRVWERIKVKVMEDGLRAKFQEPKLKALLLATGDIHLQENTT